MSVFENHTIPFKLRKTWHCLAEIVLCYIPKLFSLRVFQEGVYSFKMVTSGVLLTFLGVFVCVQGRLFRSSPETCSTERTEMDITRTLTVTHEGVLKTVDCVARVSVNECEGSCLSTASPNVHTYPDFKKVKISFCKTLSLLHDLLYFCKSLTYIYLYTVNLPLYPIDISLCIL